MSKVLGSWSGMRKYLEQEMLAPSLHGRVRYGCTRYVGMDGCHIFEVCIDGVQVKRFSLETVNTYFIAQGYKQENPEYQWGGFWTEFLSLMEQYPASQRTEYTDQEFCSALEYYRNNSIQVSIHSDDPMVRMFAVLDRRIGKRTLSVLQNTLETQPLWLQEFYQLRLTAESR